MKKRNERVRKSLKRKKKEKDRGIVDLMMIMHFFSKNFLSGSMKWRIPGICPISYTVSLIYYIWDC